MDASFIHSVEIIMVLHIPVLYELCLADSVVKINIFKTGYFLDYDVLSVKNDKMNKIKGKNNNKK